MSWQLAIFLSIVSSVALALVQRHYSIRSQAPSTFPPAISYLLGVTPLGIITGLLLPHHIHWTWYIALLFISNSITIGIGNWMLFSAVKKMPVVPFKIVNQFYEITAIVLGWTFLHEHLTLGQTAGAVLLFVAALLAIRASGGQTQSKMRFSSPVIIATIGALLFGTSLVIEKAALGRMDMGAYLIFGWSAQTLAMLILALKDANRHTIRNFGFKEIKWSALMGLAAGTSGVFYVVALVKSDNISLVTALTALSLPLIALAAYTILKEREDSRLLWTSVILSTVGLFLTTLH